MVLVSRQLRIENDGEMQVTINDSYDDMDGYK